MNVVLRFMDIVQNFLVLYKVKPRLTSHMLKVVQVFAPDPTDGISQFLHCFGTLNKT